MGDTGLEALVRSNPAEALKRLQKLQEKVMVPHEGQIDVLSSKHRFKVLNAGRRWGKTKVGVKTMLAAARSEPNQVVWWVAPTYKVVKRGYRECLRQLPKEFLLHEPPPETNFDAGRSVILRLKNGSVIEFYSAERPGGMLGEGVNFVVMDEAATIPSLVWEQTIRPTLSDTGGRGILISTPRGRNWFYRRWQMGQDQMEVEWKSWTFPSVTNPYLPDAEVEAARNELPTLLFEQEYEAKFLAAGSSVFIWGANIQRLPILENGLIEGSPPHGHNFVGVDLAKTNDYTVLYGANESDLRNTFFERFNSVRWSEQKRRIARSVRTLERNGASGVTLVIDSTGVGDPIVEDLEDAGYDVIGINFTGMKGKMVTRLAKDLEKGKAFLLEDGELVEFENYQMAATPRGVITYSAPEGEHDDAVSAKMLQHWGIAAEGSPDVVAVSAEDEISGPRIDSESADPEFDEDDYVPEGESWDDLIDDQPLVPVPRSPGVVEGRPPTPEELLLRDSVFE